MGNFYRDNKDIENVIDLLDLSEVATLLEEGFKFAKEYDFAPKDAADAIDNYKRALDVCGDVMANRIAPLAEEILYRAMLFGGLASQGRPVRAALLSSRFSSPLK